jgi:predicted phage-related endonuclease
MTQAENRNITNLSGRTVVAGPSNRRSFIGGSDARVIMGDDESALLRLWKEKRGEAEPEDLSGNLIVQLGLVTEDLNRQWYERNCGATIRMRIQRQSG